MTIIATDVKIYESERMTEATDGGGLITDNTVVCSEMNAVFPDISRIDRLYGRTQFRKVFPKIISPNTDVYSGGHFIVNEAPEDTNIGIIMFDIGTKDDEHSDMTTYFEDYYQIGPKCGTATLAYQAEIGSESLVFQTEVVDKYRVYEEDDQGVGRWFWLGTSTVYTLPATPGEVFCIESGGNAEFVHVVKIEVQREYSPEDQFINKMKYRTFTILYLAKPTTLLHAIGVSMYSKQVNPNWWCYGTMRLSEAVAPGASSLPVVSEKVRIMPTVSIPVIVEDYPVYPSSTIVDSVVFGTVPYQFTLNGIPQPYVGESRPVIVGQTVYVHIVKYKPTVTDTMTIRYRSQNKWRLMYEFGGVLSGDGSGKVDLINGVVAFRTTFTPDQDTDLIFQYKIANGYEEYTGNTIGSPGTLPVTLDFGTQNIIPGSVFFDITTATGTYHIQDNSKGILEPNNIRFLADPDFNDVEYSVSDLGGTGLDEDSNIEYGMERYWWFGRKFQHQSTSTDGKTWVRELVADIANDMQNKRIEFSSDIITSNNTMTMVGETYLWKRVGYNGTWTDITANKPVPGDTFHDIAYFEHTTWAPNGIWVAVSNSSPYYPINSTDNGVTWAYGLSRLGPYPMDRVIAVIDVFGNYWFIGAGESTYAAKNNDVIWLWETKPLANLGQPCMGIAQSANTKTVIIVGKTAMKIAWGGYIDLGWNDWYSRLQLVPEIAGRDIVDIACSPNGHWVISFDNTGVKEYLAISGNDGKTWTVYAPDNGSWGNADNSEVSNVCYDALRDQFVWLQRKVSGADEIYFRTNILKISEYPFSPIGTVDYENGTGEITTGENITASITVNLFLSKLDYKTFAFPLMITPPITSNSVVVSAKQDNSSATDKSISEIGGSIVGNGLMEINHEHGYVRGSFDVSVQPDSIVARCAGSSFFHPEYDEYDSSRMPTDGLVPACKPGDTVIINDGVNYDACIVTRVTKQQIIIAVESGLAHGYASGTLVSAAVVAGDLQALEGNYFSESVWPGGWYDTMQGIPATGTWNSINYPATVVNNSCITERWSVEVTQAAPTTLVKVTGEAVGIVLTNFDVHLADLAPTNAIAPRGGQLYIYYDGGTVLATVGETITGGSSLNTAVVDEILGDATSGMLILSACSAGDFQDDESLTGSISMVATTNAVSVLAFSSIYFDVPIAAWSVNGTFVVGDIFRFNTTGTETPLWLLRSLNARTSDTAVDDFILESRGDIALN